MYGLCLTAAAPTSTIEENVMNVYSYAGFSFIQNFSPDFNIMLSKVCRDKVFNIVGNFPVPLLLGGKFWQLLF